MRSKKICLLLHDIRSVHNVGAIFRTADAIGASKIYLSGYTPTPLDRFGRPRQDFSKCSLGAEMTVAWEYAKTPVSFINRAIKEKFQIVSVEQSDISIDYKEAKIEDKVMVIFGNEVSGVSKALLKKSDVVAELPMKGKKESLNVSVAAGIVLFRWFDR